MEKLEIMQNCKLCPRECGVDRIAGNKGACGQDAGLVAARAALHMWEEPCISGKSGSGAVFFSGCQLKCVFCQNYNISDGSVGKEISTQRLAEIFLELMEKGANNINLVTPTHFVPYIIKAVEDSRRQGMNLPIVYNTSAYEKVDTIRALEGIVDVYLPDLKYYSSELSHKYSKAKDYFEKATLAIEEMVRQHQKPLFFKRTGNELLKSGHWRENMNISSITYNKMSEVPDEILMGSGVIIRHLLLPGQLADSRKVIRYISENYRENVYVSMMDQFTPVVHQKVYTELNRKVESDVYEALIAYAQKLGINNAFVQGQGVASESFIPAFDMSGI